ncbi:MAG: hypothetical protein AAGD18_03160 [Actinomycetota bacterium]
MTEWRQLILLGDIDELLREVERLAERRDWELLFGLRRACRSAYETGHQLWPVSDWASYRLVLEGPADLATEVLRDPPPAFPLGPLTETLAQVRAWDEVEVDLVDPIVRASFAQERVLRGEALDDLELSAELVEVPLRLASWEPEYVLATYSPDGVDPGEPPFGGALPGPRLPAGQVVSDRRTTDAFEQLVAHRAAAGELTVRSVAVEGSAEEAVGCLVEGPSRWSELDAGTALATWCWLAAGGPRRSGAAAGRVRTWWALAAAADLLDDWPLEADELGDVLDELRFAVFAPEAEPATIGLAVGDPTHGVAWALRLDPVIETT